MICLFLEFIFHLPPFLSSSSLHITFPLLIYLRVYNQPLSHATIYTSRRQPTILCCPPAPQMVVCMYGVMCVLHYCYYDQSCLSLYLPDPFPFFIPAFVWQTRSPAADLSYQALLQYCGREGEAAASSVTVSCAKRRRSVYRALL